jgi:hypothetical protein
LTSDAPSQQAAAEKGALQAALAFHATTTEARRFSRRLKSGDGPAGEVQDSAFEIGLQSAHQTCG